MFKEFASPSQEQPSRTELGWALHPAGHVAFLPSGPILNFVGLFRSTEARASCPLRHHPHRLAPTLSLVIPLSSTTNSASAPKTAFSRDLVVKRCRTSRCVPGKPSATATPPHHANSRRTCTASQTHMQEVDGRRGTTNTSRETEPLWITTVVKPLRCHICTFTPSCPGCVPTDISLMLCRIC